MESHVGDVIDPVAVFIGDSIDYGFVTPKKVREVLPDTLQELGWYDFGTAFLQDLYCGYTILLYEIELLWHVQSKHNHIDNRRNGYYFFALLVLDRLGENYCDGKRRYYDLEKSKSHLEQVQDYVIKCEEYLEMLYRACDRVCDMIAEYPDNHWPWGRRRERISKSPEHRKEILRFMRDAAPSAIGPILDHWRGVDGYEIGVDCVPESKDRHLGAGCGNGRTLEPALPENVSSSPEPSGVKPDTHPSTERNSDETLVPASQENTSPEAERLGETLDTQSGTECDGDELHAAASSENTFPGAELSGVNPDAQPGAVRDSDGTPRPASPESSASQPESLGVSPVTHLGAECDSGQASVPVLSENASLVPRPLGVSVLDAALILNDGDLDLARNTRSRWRCSASIPPTKRIGISPEHSQVFLYKVKDVYDYAYRFEGRKCDVRNLFTELESRVRHPRAAS